MATEALARYWLQSDLDFILPLESFDNYCLLRLMDTCPAYIIQQVVAAFLEAKTPSSRVRSRPLPQIRVINTTSALQSSIGPVQLPCANCSR